MISGNNVRFYSGSFETHHCVSKMQIFWVPEAVVYKVTTMPWMFKEDMDLSGSWSGVVSEVL